MLNSSPGELWVEELQRDAHSTERFWKIQKLRKNPSSQPHAITLVSIWLVCFWMPLGINLSLNSSKRESKPGQSQILWEFSSKILSQRKSWHFVNFQIWFVLNRDREKIASADWGFFLDLRSSSYLFLRSSLSAKFSTRSYLSDFWKASVVFVHSLVGSIFIYCDY